MKKCSYCGRDNPADARYCHECGTEFKAPESPTTPTARSEEPARPEFEFAPLSEADRQKDLITLVSCRALAETDMVAGGLRAPGMQAFIPDENLMKAIAWSFNAYGFVRVQISPKDSEKVRDLLDQD